MADIQIVQGDDKHIQVTFCGKRADIVEAFYFTSRSLNINKYISSKEVDENWYIALTSEETAQLPVGVHSFDITVKTVDSDTLTGLYHGIVCVKGKDNNPNII